MDCVTSVPARRTPQLVAYLSCVCSHHIERTALRPWLNATLPSPAPSGSHRRERSASRSFISFSNFSALIHSPFVLLPSFSPLSVLVSMLRDAFPHILQSLLLFLFVLPLSSAPPGWRAAASPAIGILISLISAFGRT